MKKSLLVISVILLIAGLFISCNSEAAGTNSEVGYVKFGDSKALTASVDHESGPAISSLHWYYKATKTSGGIAIGQTANWTSVNDSTGLVGQIGPFSRGSWAFELVGTTSTSAPENTSYDPEGTGGSKWTIEDASVKYYGVSGTTGEENRTPITLTTGTTVIPVSLKWRQTSTTATVKFDNVSVLDSSDTMVLPAGTTVYLTVKFGDDVLANDISVTKAAAENNVYYSNSTGLTISAGILGTKNLYVEVYEDSARTSKVQEGSVGFTADAGDTITITGNIGSLEAYYGEFLNSSKTAYVFNGSSFSYYDTLEEAIDAAAAGNTVGLLKDIESAQIEITNKSITIDGNGHTLTSTATTTLDKTDNKYTCFAILFETTDDYAAELLNNEETMVCSVRNLNVSSTTARYGLYFNGLITGSVENCSIDIPGSSICSGAYWEESTTPITVYPTIVRVEGSTVGLNVADATVEDWMHNVLSVSSGGTLIVNGGEFKGEKALTSYSSGGTIIVNGGSFDGGIKIYKTTYSGQYKDGTDLHSEITINGGSFIKTYNNVIMFAIDTTGLNKLEIKGGSFPAEPNAYVDTDLYNVDHTDSTWTVTPKSGN